MKSYIVYHFHLINPKSIVCLFLFLVFIVLLLSIGTVEPIEYGIIYNAITKTVDASRVYPGGWYFIGPINSFITFASTK